MRSIESNNLIDYFIVCGLNIKSGPEPNEEYDKTMENACKCPPLKCSYRSKILHKYPDTNLPWNRIDDNAITKLCLPKGVLFDKHEHKPKFHPFIVTKEDGSRVYGGSVIFYELIDDNSICSAMQTLHTMFAAEYDKTVPNHSNYNISKDKLYATKCISVISQHPLNYAFHKILHTLYDMVKNTDLLGISLESHIYNLIYELQMISPSTCMQFHVGCKAISVHMPSNSDLRLFEYDLFEFFKLLGVNNIVNLFTTALLEHQILLYSKDYHRLMLVAESLTTLMFPFTWVKPYVPIVPSSNLHFIEAPVPYIMGFHNENIDKDYFKQGQRCFVDIDSGTVICPEGVPELPDKQQFMKEINEILVHFTNSRKTSLKSTLNISTVNYKYLKRINSKSMNKKLRNLKESRRRSKPKLLNEKNSIVENVTDEEDDFDDEEEEDDDGIDECDTDAINGDNDDDDDEEDDIEEEVEGKNSDVSSGEDIYHLKDEEEEDDGYSILQKSQAFSRIAELARKAGALNDDHQYLVDSTLDRIKKKNSRKHSRPSIGGNIQAHASTVVVNSTSSSSSSSSGISIDHSSSSKSSTLNSNKNSRLTGAIGGGDAAVATTTRSLVSLSFKDQNQEQLFTIDEIIKMQFATAIRELFLEHFIHLFSQYEKFVMLPSAEYKNIDDWWTNREHMDNFDSKMFLIEQPSPYLPFLSHFLSTQMFVSFIDLKIMSFYQQSDPTVTIFDSRIKKQKTSDNLSSFDSGASYMIKIDCMQIEEDIRKKLSKIHFNAPCAHSNKSVNNSLEPVTTSPSNNKYHKRENYLFENIDSRLLKYDEEFLKKSFQKKEQTAAMKREQFSNHDLKFSLDKPNNNKDKKATSRKFSAAATTNVGAENEKNLELNPIFIQSLLNESKTKTKRMLVDKMPEAIILGHGQVQISGVEENMLIASLCDLIERIWGHGLHSKSGKSPLWNHLMNYRKLVQYMQPTAQIDSKLTPTLLWCVMKKRVTLPINTSHKPKILTPRAFQRKALNTDHCDTSRVSNRSFENTAHSLPRKRSTLGLPLSVPPSKHASPSVSPSRGGEHHPHHQRTASTNHCSLNQRRQSTSICDYTSRNDLLNDLATIDKLTEVRTEIGLARAFVRLSLEKKLLGDHLRQLLSEAELLRALYKRHAFLRQEDEREQFIFHLKSLNVVDYFCFTNHFRSIPTNYSVSLVPSKRFNASTTSANAYIKIFGSLGESDVCFIPRSCLDFVISCDCNLGPLTTLTIGHDNAGITPKWMIEYVMVRNEITGHIHKFPCGKWLGRGVDDDSLERLLIAEPKAYTDSREMTSIQTLHNSASTRSRSPTSRSNDNKMMFRWLQKHFSFDESSNNSEKINNNNNNSTDSNIRMNNRKAKQQLFRRRFSFNSPISTSNHNEIIFETQSPPIQEMLGDSINVLVKYFEKPACEQSNLTNLICGENGLVNSLETVFQFGFRSSKFFKKLYVWDFLEKVANELENDHFINNNSPPTQQRDTAIIEKYIRAIRAINTTLLNYGKDGKFQIFICLACRESMLADWYKLICQTQVVIQMYEEYSFLRNQDLYKFCTDILDITKQFEFKLEISLTMGIQI